MKKVLITGATGMLGNTLIPLLSKKDFNVISHGLETDTPVIPAYTYDLTDLENTRKLLEKEKPDIIINLIALVNVDKCDEDPNLAYRLNVLPVENIVHWLKKNPASRLIQISSDMVYDGKGPHKEDQISLTNIYAFSKYSGELAAMQVDSTVLRINFFGNSRTKTRVSFSDWLLDILREQKSVTLFTDVFFSPLNMVTLSECLYIVASNPIPGVFNLGCRDGMTKRDFAMYLANIFNLPTGNVTNVKSSDSDLKAYRPFDMRMDVRLFETTFGITLPDLKSEIKKLKTE
jgi:dTDP-4-dehydrorhamnose reductase